MTNDNISTLLEARRVLNEQVVALMYVDLEDEAIPNIKGLLNGAIRLLNEAAERAIKDSHPPRALAGIDEVHTPF